MKILVTGAAGFIGFHLVRRLVERGDDVIGLDSLEGFYPIEMKKARLRECGVLLGDDVSMGETVRSELFDNYRFVYASLGDKERLDRLFGEECFDVVVNLAAQTGVRASLESPSAYIDSNVVGFANLLEVMRLHGVGHLVYASSSSVYGDNKKVPFSESDTVDDQVSVYAATKKVDEVLARSYSMCFGIPMTGLRFFTVYGPWGRPDMAPMLFTKAILEGRPIKVFNYGNLSRDFTYVGDIVEGIVRVIEQKPVVEEERKFPYALYNIGNGRPMPLMDFIHALESELGVEAQLDLLPMQPGDVHTTFADTSLLETERGYRASTDLSEGIASFVAWYKKYHG